MNFILKLFTPKNEYIGLTSFKNAEVKKPEVKKVKANIERTTLTGLIKRTI